MTSFTAWLREGARGAREVGHDLADRLDDLGDETGLVARRLGRRLRRVERALEDLGDDARAPGRRLDGSLAEAGAEAREGAARLWSRLTSRA